MRKPGRGQTEDKAAGREDDIRQNSGDCDIYFDSGDFLGVGHSDPPLKAEDAKRALLNGFIHLDHLIGFLAEDEGLVAALPALWDFFDCYTMAEPSQNEDFPDPLLAWRKLAYVWAGFVEPATGAVLPPFQRLQAYDYEPAQRKFIPAEGSVPRLRPISKGRGH